MDHLWTATDREKTEVLREKHATVSITDHTWTGLREPVRRKLAKHMLKRGLRSSDPQPVTCLVGSYPTVFSPEVNCITTEFFFAFPSRKMPAHDLELNNNYLVWEVGWHNVLYQRKTAFTGSNP